MSLSKVNRQIIHIAKRLSHQYNAEYQYWQRSIIHSMHFQPSLPRLPIPKLEKTCERYLNAQQPLLTNETFKQTQKYVEQFKCSQGKVLHELLVAKNKKNKYSSYISEPWFNMYLSDRKTLPINYNPALIFADRQPTDFNQLLKSTNLIISSLRFYKSLQSDILEPEVYHMNPKKSNTEKFRSICSKIPSSFSWYAAYFLFNAYPLDMSQYYNLFNSTRIPQIDKDTIYSCRGSKHVLIQYKGHFYVVNVLDDNGNILPPQKILGSVQSILSATAISEFPLGILTTLNRNEWAKLRQRLVDLGNDKSVNLIDSALFNICLDSEDLGLDPIELCRHFLHSDGKNRWFDKSLSLIVAKNGVAGINFEHSWGDGVAALRYMQDVHKDYEINPQVHPDTIPFIEEENVHRLDFNLDDTIKNSIVEAAKDYNTKCSSLDINVLQLDRLGKQICKKYALSPDAIMQLGFQVANYKLSGKFVGSYESCSTAAFKHGRTETIRPCTMATKDYSLAVHSKKSNQELLQLILTCSKLHGKLTKDAAMGQGFDRHLFALKLFTNDKLDIYEDHAYAALNHHIISSSTLATSVISIGGFGPVVNDGYGIAYSIKDDSLGVLVTSYLNQANGSDFINALKESYQEILSVLESNGK